MLHEERMYNILRNFALELDEPVSNKKQARHLAACGVLIGAEYQSAASGLWYRNPDAAGDIAAIRVNGKIYSAT